MTALDDDYGPYLLAGALVYLGGTIAMTMAFHVPRNNELAATDPGSSEGKEVWARYLAEWTRGNHIRALSGVVAAAPLRGGPHRGLSWIWRTAVIVFNGTLSFSTGHSWTASSMLSISKPRMPRNVR